MLKNVLSLLLSKFYSKKDAAEIAALALPNNLDGIAISITEGTNTYIAPADGYINFVTARNGGVNVYGQCLQTNSYPSTNRQAKAFVPISKGKKIIFEIGGETISATFYKLIGGGESLRDAFLQGGGLCLNSLSSSLRRSSCRINVRLSRRGITRRIPEPNYSLLQGRTTILSLPPTALSRLFCAKILKGLDLALSHKGAVTAKNAQELMRQTYLDGTRHSSLFKKASGSNFHPRFSAPLQDVSFCLTKPNLTVGGASC